MKIVHDRLIVFERPASVAFDRATDVARPHWDALTLSLGIARRPETGAHRRSTPGIHHGPPPGGVGAPAGLGLGAGVAGFSAAFSAAVRGFGRPSRTWRTRSTRRESLGTPTYSRSPSIKTAGPNFSLYFANSSSRGSTIRTLMSGRRCWRRSETERTRCS